MLMLQKEHMQVESVKVPNCLFYYLFLYEESETLVSKNPKLPVSTSNDFHHV